MKRLTSALLLTFLTLSSAHAKLVAHYDFSDGDLLDNEVGPAFQLKNAGEVPVTLGAAGAVFTSSTKIDSPQSYLMVDSSRDLTQFTVSFWMRTDVVDQGGAFPGIFSSNTLTDLGSFQFFSAGQPVVGNKKTEDGSLLLIAGQARKKLFTPTVAAHNSNTWYHVGLVSDGGQLTTTISSVDGSFGDLLDGAAISLAAQLKNFAFGVNRGLNHGYGFELANVRVYDSVKPLEPLYKAGKKGNYVDIPEPANVAIAFGFLSIACAMLRRRSR
ncbi:MULTISPECIES: LamG domain-containing protein [unclassified Lentimonas]|uniref:LamG domain-containing protein n=1 Tax=unclassified Lentimonas TaxID=2630993 RepID=UPI001326F807|nr:MULTISPECIES: LamG domain-containing protein [unclassified Lentimonas]CAA6677774.1 Unannotated [Lentimonas sp. CC4]CAA6685039.1 Unannotated [Lentimonas sp. CC6]CAA6691672.1 Unannotated [Lentimonas sp. CC19]CAA6695986.1 Unannotated [Lentimonas sp. CC10]CAA7070026.1 Unannotated [Lentimonas sp. CC11]